MRTVSEKVDRSTVLEAAAACFLTFGFKATTVEHVAEQAGTSRTTVIRLVGGRQKLIDAVLVAEATQLLSSLAPLADEVASLEDLIGGVVRLALEEVDQRPLLRRAAGPDILSLLPGTTTSGVPMISTLTAGGLLLLGGVRENLGVADLDVAHFEELVEDLIRFILGMLHTPTIDGRNRDPEVAAARAIALFVPAFAAAARRARAHA